MIHDSTTAEIEARDYVRALDEWDESYWDWNMKLDIAVTGFIREEDERQAAGQGKSFNIGDKPVVNEIVSSLIAKDEFYDGYIAANPKPKRPESPGDPLEHLVSGMGGWQVFRDQSKRAQNFKDLGFRIRARYK